MSSELQMQVSQLLEGRYSSLVVRSMTVQSKNMRKKRRIKVEKAGETFCCFSIDVGRKIFSILVLTIMVEHVACYFLMLNSLITG